MCIYGEEECRKCVCVCRCHWTTGLWRRKMRSWCLGWWWSEYKLSFVSHTQTVSLHTVHNTFQSTPKTFCSTVFVFVFSYICVFPSERVTHKTGQTSACDLPSSLLSCNPVTEDRKQILNNFQMFQTVQLCLSIVFHWWHWARLLDLGSGGESDGDNLTAPKRNVG
jgi:hypothetical protein